MSRRILHHPIFKSARNWYARFERPISSFSLIGGFVFNAVALTRADEFWENFWIIIHILMVAAFIILINRQENEGTASISSEADPKKLHFWLVNALQFVFGGLLSTFLVFYFRSAALSASWPFFLILLIAFIANERLKRRYARLDFQISFLFLSLFLFSIYFVPVVTHEIGDSMFIFSGLASLFILIVFLYILNFFTKESFKEGKLLLFASIFGIFLAVNILYFFKFIPPLPLSLTDAGVYHSITRNVDRNYEVTYEEGDFWNTYLPYVDRYATYHTQADKPVYVFSAIFLPGDFNLSIFHEWQMYDVQSKTWVTVSKIPLSVIGGRNGGYRTYSILRTPLAGKWRVNVTTESGQLIGRLIFNIEIADMEPVLQTKIK